MNKVPFTVDKRMGESAAIAVFEPHGQLNGHPDCFQWLEEVRRDIQVGQKHLVLNLHDVTRIDSTGVGILASLHVSAANAGGKLCLTGLTDRQRMLLESTWLLRVIENADTEAAAIRLCLAPKS